eukprot:scaffold32920_cov129-Isochrysis_galbana.AAC.5
MMSWSSVAACCRPGAWRGVKINGPLKCRRQVQTTHHIPCWDATQIRYPGGDSRAHTNPGPG